MILTNKLLKEYEDNYRISIPNNIKNELLKMYAVEPSNTHEWSLQDIHEGMRKYLNGKESSYGNKLCEITKQY